MSRTGHRVNRLEVKKKRSKYFLQEFMEFKSEYLLFSQKISEKCHCHYPKLVVKELSEENSRQSLVCSDRHRLVAKHFSIAWVLHLCLFYLHAAQ